MAMNLWFPQRVRYFVTRVLLLSTKEYSSMNFVTVTTSSFYFPSKNHLCPSHLTSATYCPEYWHCSLSLRYEPYQNNPSTYVGAKYIASVPPS
jgi:hypothetical protein